MWPVVVPFLSIFSFFPLSWSYNNYSGWVVNTTIILLGLAGYRMIITNSARYLAFDIQRASVEIPIGWSKLLCSKISVDRFSASHFASSPSSWNFTEIQKLQKVRDLDVMSRLIFETARMSRRFAISDFSVCANLHEKINGKNQRSVWKIINF